METTGTRSFFGNSLRNFHRGQLNGHAAHTVFLVFVAPLENTEGIFRRFAHLLVAGSVGLPAGDRADVAVGGNIVVGHELEHVVGNTHREHGVGAVEHPLGAPAHRERLSA